MKQFQKLPLGLPHYDSNWLTDQALPVSIVPTTRCPQTNYTFGDLGNELWVGPWTQWVHCDLNLVQATFIAWIFYILILMGKYDATSSLQVSMFVNSDPVSKSSLNVWVIFFHCTATQVNVSRSLWGNYYYVYLCGIRRPFFLGPAFFFS